ncbi:hypothetical protein PQR68_13005 [Paraburkholderia agricolaris]|uniref:hypothetical protein n=1 Tax=Paraburkholderia agricolaris TaxID=2152888 RepID=UPI001292AD7F|nr:hypothetical protein [Paraburkholderia agricolaris]
MSEQSQTCGKHAVTPGPVARTASGAQRPTFDLNPPILTNALNKSLHACNAYQPAASEKMKPPILRRENRLRTQFKFG